MFRASPELEGFWLLECRPHEICCVRAEDIYLQNLERCHECRRKTNFCGSRTLTIRDETNIDQVLLC